MRASGLRVDDVASVLRCLVPVCAVLCRDRVLQIRCRGSVVAAALCKLCLQCAHACCLGSLCGEGALHVCDLIRVQLLRYSILCAGHRSSNASEATAESGLDIAEAGCDRLLDAGYLCRQLLIAEAVRDVFAVVQPRIETEATALRAHHCASPAETAEASPSATENEEKENPCPITTEPEATVLIAVAIHRLNRHHQAVAAFFSKCHNE